MFLVFRHSVLAGCELGLLQNDPASHSVWAPLIPGVTLGLEEREVGLTVENTPFVVTVHDSVVVFLHHQSGEQAGVSLSTFRGHVLSHILGKGPRSAYLIPARSVRLIKFWFLKVQSVAFTMFVGRSVIATSSGSVAGSEQSIL